jgi:hypothetical protein
MAISLSVKFSVIVLRSFIFRVSASREGGQSHATNGLTASCVTGTAAEGRAPHFPLQDDLDAQVKLEIHHETLIRFPCHVPTSDGDELKAPVLLDRQKIPPRRTP